MNQLDEAVATFHEAANSASYVTEHDAAVVMAEAAEAVLAEHAGFEREQES